MPIKSSAALIIRAAGGVLKTEIRDALLGSILAHGGIEISRNDGVLLASFPGTFAAARSALDIQKSIAASKICDGLDLQAAVDHIDTPDPGRILDDKGRNNLLALASLAEIGGIILSRTVYDEVRFQIKVEYDTRLDPQQVAFVCQEIRRKLNVLDLDELSVVRISRDAAARYGEPSPNLAISLMSRMFSRLSGGAQNNENVRLN